MLEEVIRSLGGDPTAVTPSANIHAVSSRGLCAVIADPRTDLQQSLEAALIAELADNDCWLTLVALAKGFSRDDLAGQFAEALEHEQEHLLRVRAWVGAAVSFNAFGKMDAAFLAMPEQIPGTGVGRSERNVAGTASRTDNPDGKRRKTQAKRATRGSGRDRVGR
jgi:hypothetical protein